MRELGELLSPAAPLLDAHDAAQAAWAWSSLARDFRTASDWASPEWGLTEHDDASPPVPLQARASALPFAVHLGVCQQELGDPEGGLEALLEECRPSRGTIASGSAVSLDSKTAVPEQRLTAWQSAVAEPFRYSGKEMAPAAGGFSARVGAVRDRIDEAIERSYDSCLINYYENGKSGMRFHHDPGQGEEWGFSTAVVSVGDARMFVFREAEAKERKVSFALRHGDIVEMWGECQSVYQHSVKVEAASDLARPRISLVYKRTMATERARRSVERAEWEPPSGAWGGWRRGNGAQR